MKLTIEKNALVPMLSMLKHGIGNNTIIPILDNIKVYTKDGLLYMQTSDNNMTVTVSQPSDKLGLDDYSFLLHSSAIPLLTQLKSGEIEIEANPETNVVKIKQEKNVYKIGMEDVNDYPTNDKNEYHGICELDFAILKEALTNAMIFVSSNDSVSMRGILLEIENQKITVVATDAHVLLRTIITCESHIEGKQKIIIPTKIVAALKTVKHSGGISIATNENSCTFSFGNVVFKQRLIDENYPTYEAVIPKAVETTIKVNKAEFIETLKRLSVLANKTTSGLAMVFNSSKMCITAADLDKGTDGKEYLSVDSDTPTPKFIGFSEGKMSSVLPCIAGNEIELNLTNSNRGAIIINEHTEDSMKMILVMPIMLAETIETLQNLLR